MKSRKPISFRSCLAPFTSIENPNFYEDVILSRRRKTSDGDWNRLRLQSVRPGSLRNGFEHPMTSSFSIAVLITLLLSSAALSAVEPEEAKDALFATSNGKVPIQLLSSPPWGQCPHGAYH